MAPLSSLLFFFPKNVPVLSHMSSLFHRSKSYYCVHFCGPPSFRHSLAVQDKTRTRTYKLTSLQIYLCIYYIFTWRRNSPTPNYTLISHTGMERERERERRKEKWSEKRRVKKKQSEKSQETAVRTSEAKRKKKKKQESQSNYGWKIMMVGSCFSFSL